MDVLVTYALLFTATAAGAWIASWLAPADRRLFGWAVSAWELAAAEVAPAARSYLSTFVRLVRR
jgi:hypothetical protein